MTDPTPLAGGPLGTALHERLRDEQPDLDRLVRASTLAGTRIRRRRRAGAALAGTAGVAAVVVGVAMLDGSAGAPRGGPGFAGDPPASWASAAGQQQPQPLTREARVHARALRALQDAPVYVDSADWRCDRPADEKFICSHAGASVVVTWRPAAFWADYQDPGKAGEETFVSEVHGEFFATVAPGASTTRAQVDEVGRALVWAE